MKKRNKLGLLGICLCVALFASGCTASFATNIEKSRIADALEPGVSRFVIKDSEEEKSISEEFKIADESIELFNIVQVVEYSKNEDGSFKEYSNSALLNQVIEQAKTNKVLVPNKPYFVELERRAFAGAVAEYNAMSRNAALQLDLTNPDVKAFNNFIENYGYLRFYSSNNMFANYDRLNEEICEAHGGYGWENSSYDFQKFYKTSISNVVEQYKSTITVYDKVKYGNYNDKQITLEKVTWKEAWGKGGHLIEGLIVYPVAWMIDGFALLFAGGKNASPAAIQEAYLNGVPQILSILIVTIIVRLFIFLVTFRSTLAQRKMNDLQPELAKIQQKYPNSNTNQAQKQRLAEEQMRLYKKHKINPLSQLLVLIVQFPVFIGVWGAMTGSAVLSTGKFLDLHLSDSIWNTLRLGPKGHAGWWTALVLILVMSAAQFFSMKVPQWIQKAKTKKVARLGANPAQKQQNKTANIVSYVMLIMIIVMGFTLPAAMGVYWFVGAIVSLIQTIFTSVIFTGNKKRK